ncbi:MAG: hydroxyethylthiazole kinase [Eubacterium sp.]
MTKRLEKLTDIFTYTRKTPQLVHNITNYVTVNDCANILLAMGSSPIMADDINEVEEITSICSALVINIGTLNSRTIESMIVAGKKANVLGHPVILDPVGAGASTFRTETVYRLLREVKFTVIRGNISEIKTVNDGVGTTKGVDADEKDMVSLETLDGAVSLAQNLSLKTGAVIAITGTIDIVANSKLVYIIKNGHPDMSKITGTGCMLTAMLGAYVAANPNEILAAVACGVSVMGLAGELAVKRVISDALGTGSLRSYIIDNISKMTDEIFEGGAKVEIRYE